MNVSVLILLAALAQPERRAIDPGTADSSPLRRSLRVLPLDQRHPAGFERVYETGDGRYMRASGGLRAVFPRSVYGSSGAEIPPGTRFIIGDDPTLDRQEREERRYNPNRVDRSAEPFVDAEPVREPISLWTDSELRLRVLDRLIERAVEAG